MSYLSPFNDNLSSPWRGLMDLQRNLDRMFDQAFGPGNTEDWSDSRVFHPACDLDETESHYVMSVDLPGVPKKDIHIEVRGNQLFISGERKSERKAKGGSERFYGKFHRMITMPEGIDADKIEAQYQDGVLTLALPKAESARPRQIRIGEGKGSFLGKLLGKSQGQEKESRPERDVSEVKVA